MKARPLTARERSFLTHYRGKARGNATKAALAAGYAKGSARITASRLLSRANIRQALEQKLEVEAAKGRAEAAERDLLLSDIARSQEDAYVRIQAIKELNKVDGRHIFKLQVEGKLTLVDSLQLSRELPNDEPAEMPAKGSIAHGRDNS